MRANFNTIVGFMRTERLSEEECVLFLLIFPFGVSSFSVRNSIYILIYL